MLKLHSKKLALYLASILFILTAFVVSNHVITNVQAETSLASRLSGKILLQVEDNGEAWYLNPQDNKRSYLGRPHDAYNIMREEGIGITNDNLEKIPLSLDNLSGEDTDSDKLPDNFEIAIGTNPESSDTDSDGYDDYVEVLNNNSPRGDNAKRQTIDKSFAKSHQGKIFIQVEGNGEAWYVDTTENKRHYLGRPSDAFSIMRHLGLGITNTNLNQITIREGKGIQEYDYEEEVIDNSDKGEKNSENKEEYKNHITVTTHKPELMREFTSVIDVSATINDSSGYDFKEKGFLFDYTMNKDEVLKPTLANYKEKLIDNTPGLNITAEIDNLLPKSYPYIRSYVITSEDVVYYEETEVLIMGNTETIDSIGAPGTPPVFGGGGGGTPAPKYYDLIYTASDGGYLATSTEGEINELSSFEKRVKEGNSGDIIYAISDTGYSFISWSDDSTDNPRTDENVTSDMSVTANFEINDYDIIFNTNGGTGTMANQTITFNASSTLTTNTFSREGYDFTGWNTESDGSGTSYTDGASFTMDVVGITLYAQWTANNYDIIFNANGGTGTMSNQTITFNTSANLTTNSFTRANYTFTGWNTESNGSGTSYTDGSSFTMNVVGITLYAQWEMDCGDDVTFTYKEDVVTYGVVGNPDTGKCWLDRNLGATQVATSLDDPDSYGDLFQWGRGDDGHQERTSNTTSTLSSGDDPGHSNFITSNYSASFDWRSPQNDNLWQGVEGINNPCPNGFRLPTIDELETERNSWSSDNSSGAFNSPLKWSVAGYRYFNGSLSYVGSYGGIWSSSVSGSSSSRLYFDSSGAGIGSGSRVHGYSVRCLRD